MTPLALGPPLPLLSFPMPETSTIALATKPICEAAPPPLRKSTWAPPSIDLRLPPPLRPFHIEPSPPPATPQPSRANHFPDLRRLLIDSIRSILPPRRRIPPPSPKPEAGCSLPLFRPYVAKVPWHGGVRAFLSGLFPRYGHYCGPNWSSGKDGGSNLWDRRPIDWLDSCCYCHDIGYDTHDQAKLLKADIALLDCLERPRMATKGGAHAALFYRAMYIAGLRHILIPYRMQLVRLQSGPPSFGDLISNLFPKRDTIIRQA